MHFLVAGSRNMPEAYNKQICEELDKHLERDPYSIMINGMARGVDQICYEWALERQVQVEQFYAKWDIHGKAAGPIRNGVMLSHLLSNGGFSVYAFSYGPLENSRGTKNMVTQCSLKGLTPIIREFKYLDNDAIVG